MLHSVIFVVSLILVSTLTNLPFKIYSTFVIEEKWGFNKTTRKTFVCDLVKSFLISLVFTAILVPLMLWVVDAAGDKLVVSLVIFTFIVIVVINLLVPTVILPLFYKFTDLEDGQLKTDIFKEAEKTKIPVSQIKVIDGSQRSSHSNAFVSGFGSARKVVIFDTLIE
jgi:STE24 endopeptidase